MSYAKVLIICGRKRTGKTTFTLEKLLANRSKVLVVDTYDHPAYRQGFGVLPGDEVAKWKGKKRTFDRPPAETLVRVFESCFDGVVLVEDAAKTLTGNVPVALKQGFGDNRNKGIDLILMFHSLDDIPPYICRMFDTLILFATDDDPDVRLDKFKIRWRKIEPALRAQLDAADKAAKEGRDSWTVKPKFINFD